LVATAAAAVCADEDGRWLLHDVSEAVRVTTQLYDMSDLPCRWWTTGVRYNGSRL